MLDSALTALAQSPPAQAVTSWQFAYPLVNAGHILGLATLFGSIFALDLRLLGLFPTVPAQPLARTLPFVSLGGLALAIPTGVLLFSVDPVFYLDNPAFRTKLMLVLLGVIHAASLRFSPDWQVMLSGSGFAHPRLRVSAILSLVIWTSAIFAGRLIAYVSPA
jgi:hypothetical protein